MRENKNIKILIILLCIVMAVIFGCLIFIFVGVNHPNSNNAIENTQQNGLNTSQDLQNSNTENNLIQNSQTQNVVEPILNEITSPSTGENNGTTQELISSTYYYGQLDNNAKIIYEALKQNKENMKTGIYEIDFGTQFNTLLHTETGEQELQTAFQSAWNAFSYDQVDLFYIDTNKLTLMNEYENIGGIVTYHISIGPGENENYLLDTFKQEGSIAQAESYIQNIVNQIEEQTRQDTVVEKARRIHNWLVSSINYDQEQSNINRFQIYGALHDQKAVCEGYARSFKYLMEKVGVPCVLVSGTGTNSEGRTENHAWNYIQINNQWYAVDVTWDDPVVVGGGRPSSNNLYKYFLKGSEEFYKDHKEENVISENSMSFKFPTLSTTDYELNF